MAELTRILAAIDRGETGATAELFPIVYEELRQLAASKLRHESPGHTLQATALVHEVYLRLVGTTDAESQPGVTGEASDAAPIEVSSTSGDAWQSRGHFFAAAAEAMRRILVENARRKGRLKRGGDRERIALDQVEPTDPEPSVDLLALNEALVKLEAADKAKGDVVKLRYFAGLTIDETARALGISEATVKRHWLYARAWLRREMSKGEVD
jgi:RNA polymerase sigma factor (TIGR02999 family)